MKTKTTTKKWTTDPKKIVDGWYKILYKGPKASGIIFAIVIIEDCVVTSKYIHLLNKFGTSEWSKCIPNKCSIQELLRWGYRFSPMKERDVFIEVI